MKTQLFILIVSMAFLANPVAAKKDKHKNLPPGLQKKQQRGQPLPPGWQKKLQKDAILDINVYHRGTIVVPVDKHGLITPSIKGRLLHLDKVTRKIVDILK